MLSGVKVLVVDDDGDTVDLFSTALTLYGAIVEGVASVEEALEALARGKPDILTSDMTMPGSDGLSLIERVRSLPEDQGGRTPAIAITGHAYPADEVHSIAAGFDVHLSKPVAIRTLVVTIARLTGRHVPVLDT